MPISHGYARPQVQMPKQWLDYRTFPNGVAGSDIRLNWTGAAILPRTTHTWLRKSIFTQQTGYYACDWHCSNDGSYHFDVYESGTHPFPCSGTRDSTGQATEGGISGGTGSSGTTHYYELAGDGNGGFSSDFIASPSDANGPPLIVTKEVEVWSVRKCEIIGGTTLRRTYIPDILNNPNFKIVHDQLLSSLNTPTVPAFVFGVSPWTSSNFASTGSGTSATETAGGRHRFFMGFKDALSDSDCLLEFANEFTNYPCTDAGIRLRHYVCKNPSPTDTQDRSGLGNHPAWGNANRPLLYAP